MAKKRGRSRPASSKAATPVVVDDSEVDPSLSESQKARVRLRQRWEMASVLNFIHVFREVVGDDLKISAEEIETALITPNEDLAQIHISLLKGIPPASRNLRDNDAWVTVVCKKLATWWPWVAVGENPLEADHGEEIVRYKELDPTTRLLILKALCEVRVLQDDILRYIAATLKDKTAITAFRKERIGGDDNGSTYWYDGDNVVGYRLYRELTIVESKQKLKGKGCSTQPTNESHWETLATNLEEFREISDNLLSSSNMVEASVAEIVKTDIIPVLEELQKKKERALKRQQTQALLLNGFLNSNVNESRHSRRERKPVKYTFDEYDQTIEEAIQVSKKSKTTGSVSNSNRKVEDRAGRQDAVLNGNMDSDKENSSPDEDQDVGKGRSSDDDDDDNYDEKEDTREGSNADDKDENDSVSDSDEEGSLSSGQAARGWKDVKDKEASIYRNRHPGAYSAKAKGHAEMKKRLRQRPTRNTDYNDDILSDSEDK